MITGGLMLRRYKNSSIQTTAAVLIALVISYGVLALTSSEPLTAFGKMLFSPLTNVRYFGNVVELMVPLAFSGISTALLFRSGLFNLGGEGIFYIAGLLAAVLATKPLGTSLVHQTIVILSASLFGGLLACISGFFKAKYNANELVTSLMLNTIFFGVGFYLLKVQFRDLEVTGVASALFLDTARLPVIIPRTRVTTGICLLLAAVLAVWFVMSRTRLGYLIKMTGLNKDFAVYSGMSIFSLTLIVHFLSGSLAGMGAAVHLMSLFTRFTWSALPGYGFDGCLVAMLGRNNPLGSFAAAFVLAYLRTGADIMARSTDVPVEMVSIVEMVLVLMITADFLLKALNRRDALKSGAAGSAALTEAAR
ncbi:MAG: ABC transporter permease [Treponema sp.]|jgi:simple sugar transport system permease protein|nr:ABC transporter permease [Treponema sp.]